MKSNCHICDRDIYCKGYCKRHYQRFNRYGDPTGKPEPKPVNPRHIHTCLECGTSFINIALDSKYCSIPCYRSSRRGPFIIKDGYKKIKMRSHPRADMKGYVFEHILVIEEKLGRPLNPGEISHHINGNKLNNHPLNLDVFPGPSEHVKYHRAMEPMKYPHLVEKLPS